MRLLVLLTSIVAGTVNADIYPKIEFFCRVRDAKNQTSFVKIIEKKEHQDCAVKNEGACWRIHSEQDGKLKGSEIFKNDDVKVEAVVQGLWGDFQKWEDKISITARFTSKNPHHINAVNSIEVWKDSFEQDGKRAQTDPVVTIKCAFDKSQL